MNYRIYVNTKRLGKSRIGPGPYIYIYTHLKEPTKLSFFSFPLSKVVFGVLQYF